MLPFMKKLISLVIPCHNESINIKPLLERVITVMQSLESRFDYEVIFVNDGSKDDTIQKLFEYASNDDNIKIIDFSRNFGKEAALTAGLDFSSGDVVIPMDADLQHPPELITEMINKWEEGFEVVLARRKNRNNDTAILKFFSEKFYKVQNMMTDVPIPENVGDFRLIDKKVVEALKLLPERRRFMKGIFAWVGFKSTVVEFEVQKREHGKSSFNFWRLFNFAIEGITSFSTAPLRVWTYFGFIVALLAFLYASVIFFDTILYGKQLPGYASLICVVLFMGGVQIISIGVLGEYIGGIYGEVKKRPIYVVSRKYGFKKTDENC